nr:MAG TPA: Baseplate J like protein [Caudoviricetes sp.]
MFEDRTTENIKKEILDAIDPSLDISVMEGSYADAVVGPLAQAVSRLYKALPAAVSMLFIDPSCGRFIDLVAQDYHNLHRRSGTVAQCSMTFTGTQGTVIPAGSVFLTESGLDFFLTETVTIPAQGTATGQLMASQFGAAYNVAAGAITRMYRTIPGLEDYQNQAATGGNDPEEDSALCARVDEARKRPATSGNGWDYRRWALGVDGVGEVKVVELWDGPGTVGLTLVDSRFSAVTEKIRAAVEQAVAEKKPIGASPTVVSAKAIDISITACVALIGTTAPQVQKELERRIREHLQQLIRHKYQIICYGPEEDKPFTLLYNRVLSILLTIEGVDNFKILNVNQQTEDITIPADSVPVLREVQVDEATD